MSRSAARHEQLGLRVATAVTRSLNRRWPSHRIARTLRYRVGRRLGDEGGQLVGRLATGAAIRLLARDRHHREIYFTGALEPGVTALLRRVAVPGWTFIDVGANAGYFSLLAADLGGATSTVHAFEPNPELADLLEQSAAAHRVPIIVHREAVSDTVGVARLYASADPSNSGMAHLDDQVSSDVAVEVHTTTLDALTESGVTPDVIKIDAEDHDGQVLAGARALLGRRVPSLVVVELGDRLTPADLQSIADGVGYWAWSIGSDGTLLELGAPGCWNAALTLDAAIGQRGNVVSGACWCGATDATTHLEGRFNRLGEVDRPFRVMRCVVCGTVRTDPPPDDSQYADPERDPELSHDGSGYAAEYVRLLQSVHAGGRHLDLGCNQGHLVEAASAAGYDSIGVDIDPYSTDLARRAGRNVVTGTIDDVDGPFDLVSMVHVAEHITALPALLPKIHARLAPGGRLLIVVPNHRGAVSRLMGEKWMFWAPSEHVWHFTAATLTALVERSSDLRAERVTCRGRLEVFPHTAKGAAGGVVQRVAGWVDRGEQLEAVFVR